MIPALTPHALVTATLLLMATPALAQVPDTISFTGRLTEGDGGGVSVETDLTFTLYQHPTETTPVHWSETQTVTVSSGRFTVLLGADAQNKLPWDVLAAAPEVWLGLQVEQNPEMAPRMRVSSVPFAVRAQDAQALGGVAASGYATSDHAHAFSEITGEAARSQLPDDVVFQGDLETALGEVQTVVAGTGVYFEPDSSTLRVDEDQIKQWCYDTPAELDAVGVPRLGAPMSCVDGHVIKLISGIWQCAPDLLGATPPDQAQVEAWARGVCYDQPEELTLAGGVLLAPDVTCQDGDVLLYDSGFKAWVCDSAPAPAPTQSTIEQWARGVAYDTTDELDAAGVLRPPSCDDGSVLKADGGGWICASDEVGGGGSGGDGWALGGNSGTVEGTHFLGTTDARGFELRVEGLSAGRLWPPNFDGADPEPPAGVVADHAPNIELGYKDNDARYVPSPCIGCGTAVGRTIGGGGAKQKPNTVEADYGTVAGGLYNGAIGEASGVGGGEANAARGDWSRVGGGSTNVARGEYAALTGGLGNEADGKAAAIGGGHLNKASGWGATVPGGLGNEAKGVASVAMGQAAFADHDGSFVFNSTGTGVASTGTQQFIINAIGGVGVNTAYPEYALDVFGTIKAETAYDEIAIRAVAVNTTYAIEAINGGAVGVGLHARGGSSGVGVYGEGGTTGVRGAASQAGGVGVRGIGSSGSASHGVYGETASVEADAAGLYGKATADTAWAVYSDGNTRITGDLHLDGKIVRAGTKAISFGPEHWRERRPGCGQVEKGFMPGGFVRTTAGNSSCYTPPELDTWLVQEVPDPTDPGGFVHMPCGPVAGGECGANTTKPILGGGVLRMPLTLPDGATIVSLAVYLVPQSGSNVVDVSTHRAAWIALYERPHNATGWWGYPNVRGARFWDEWQSPAMDPYVGSFDEFDEIAPYRFETPPAQQFEVDMANNTYFLDFKLRPLDHILLGSVVITYTE